MKEPFAVSSTPLRCALVLRRMIGCAARLSRPLLRNGLLAAAIVVGLVPSAVHQAQRTLAHSVDSDYGLALPLAGAADLGPVAPDTQLSLLLVLRDPSAAREDADLAALYSPRSPAYGHYMSTGDIAARYGPSPATATRVQNALRRMGLRASWQRGDDWMEVSGPASRLESAFGVHVRWYRSVHGARFYAGDRDPSLPAVLRSDVAEAGSISSYFQPIPAAVPEGGLLPVDLLSAYDITPLRDAGIDGTGQTVVFFELDGFKQSSLDTFTSRFGLPAMLPVSKTPEPTATLSETEMDLEVVHEIAPGAKLVLYNLDWSSLQKMAASDALTAVLNLQSRMVDENPGAVISQSWGMCEKPLGKTEADAYKNVYDHADALGETVFAITHDDAAYNCLADAARGTPPSPTYLGVPLPGDAPGVTAVGGTRLSVNTNGGWYNETVWEYPGETIGTGGGVSVYYARPTWQQGPGVQDTRRNPGGMRSVPDVSADADSASGAAIYVTDQQGTQSWTMGGGTSQSAPIWAGIAALVNQYLQHKDLPRAGFLNPALYAIAADPSPYQAFHDITVGNNLYFPAGPGYDMATGLGTPDAWNLARDLESYAGGQTR